MSRWFHARGREKLGPFTLAELQFRAQQGELQPSDLVLLEGTTQWTSANSVAGLFLEATVDSPPPLPETITAAMPGDPLATAIASASVLIRDPELPDVPGYELLSLLGKGGMGVVYKARHIALNRPVALKMILAGAQAGADERKRFFTEAESVAKLRHPNIVQVYDVGEHDGVPFFSLEFCDGGSLDRRIAGSPQPAKEAAALCETLARAMDAAHQVGIIHRDLKPANVLVAFSREPLASASDALARGSRLNEGVAKITDFGLAKQLEAEDGVTRSGAIMGTPSYMAPEQAHGQSHGVGPAADIYALGAILYELLTGRVPLKGASPMDTLLLVTTVEPVPPRQLVPGVPRDLETICLKCLQKEPGKRYDSALSLADDLKQFLEGRPISARPVSTLGRLGRWSKRNPALAAVTLLLFVTFVAGMSVIVWKWREAVANYEEKEGQRLLAETNAKQANDQREIAEEREAEAKRFVYASFMNQLPDAWSQGDLASVQRYLDAFLPAPGQKEDVRGFEWYHYWKRSQGSRLTLHGHHGPITGLAFSPDGTSIVSASRDQTMKLWDTASGKVKKTLSYASLPTDLALSPDGKLLAGCYRVTAAVWNTEQWRTTFAGVNGEPICGAFWKDSKLLATAGWTLNLLQFRDPEKPPVVRSSSAQESIYQTALAFSPAGPMVITGTYGGSLLLWDFDPQAIATGPKKRTTVPAHTGQVRHIAFTRDGSLLASAGEDQTIRLWHLDRDAGKLTAAGVLQGHKGPVRSVVFTPDGHTLISAGEDGTVRLWDVEKKWQRGDLKGHSLGVLAMAISADGKQLATAGHDCCVKLWDLEQLTEQTARGAGVNALAFSPTEPLLASASDDGTVKLWDSRKGEEKGILDGHTGPVLGAAFTPDGKTLITGGGDEWLRLWDIATRRLRTRLQAADRVTSLAVSRDGSLLAAGGVHGWLSVFSLEKGELRLKERVHQERISGVNFSPDGKTLGLSSWDFLHGTYDLAGKKKQLSYQPGKVRGILFTPNGKHLLSIGPGQLVITDLTRATPPRVTRGEQLEFAVAAALARDGKAIYWAGKFGTAGILLASELKEGAHIVESPKTFSSPVPARCVAVSADGRTVALGTADGVVHLFDTAPLKLRTRLGGHARGITAVACSPDGKTLARAGPDFTVLLIDAATQRQRTILRGHSHVVSAAVFSPDGKLLATASHDRTVRLWDAVTGGERAVWRDFDTAVLSLAFSPDGETLAASTGQIDIPGVVSLRDVSTGRVRFTLAGHRSMVRGVAFAPNGKTLASVSGDGWDLPGEIKLWDAATGKERASRSGHRSPILTVAFAPDGRTLATAGEDSVVRLWDVSNPEALLNPGPQLFGHTGAVRALAFSPHGPTLASAGDDGAVRLWQPVLGQGLGLLPGHAAVRCLAFAPDSSALLAGAEDGNLAVYRAATPEELGAASTQRTNAPPLDLPSETGRLLALARIRFAAGEHSPQGFREAAQLLADLEKRHPNLDVCRRGRAEALLRLAEEVFLHGLPEAEQASQEALSLMERLAARTNLTQDRLQLGRAWHTRARVLLALTRSAESETAYRKAAELLRDLLVQDPENKQYIEEAVVIGTNLGSMLLREGRTAPARQVLQETASILEELHAVHGSTDETRGQLAELLEKQIGDRPEEQRTVVRQLIVLRNQRFVVVRGSAERREERARAYVLQGDALLASAPTSAESFYKGAAEDYEILLAAQPERHSLRSSLACCLHGQASACFRKNRMTEAEALLVRAIGLQKEARVRLPNNSFVRNRLGDDLAQYAVVLIKLGKHEDAARTVEERLTLDPDQPSAGRDAAGWLADCSRVAGLDARLSEEQRKQKAKEYADRAMQLLESLVKRGYKDVADLEKAPALNPLRMRDDFKALLQKLAGK